MSFAVSGRRRANIGAWVLMAPMVLWLVAFVVLPTAILAVYSFCGRDDFGDVVFHFTLDNYARCFEPVYLRIFGLSLWYAALTTAICVIAGYPIAYFIGRAPPRTRNALLLAVMIPFWTSFLIRTYAWLNILGEHGALNAMLQYVHVISAPLDVLYTWKAVVLGLVYSYLPFMILPIYTSVERLDASLIEAAFDLGANPWRAFRRVILPLTMPGVRAGVLIVFVPAIGMFAITDLMGGAKVPMIGNVIEGQFGPDNDWPFGAALGMLLIGLFVVAYVITPKRLSH